MRTAMTLHEPLGKFHLPPHPDSTSGLRVHKFGAPCPRCSTSRTKSYPAALCISGFTKQAIRHAQTSSINRGLPSWPFGEPRPSICGWSHQSTEGVRPPSQRACSRQSLSTKLRSSPIIRLRRAGRVPLPNSARSRLNCRLFALQRSRWVWTIRSRDRTRCCCAAPFRF